MDKAQQGKTTSMRILLTGANGMIGQQLQTALLAEGHHVVCATRSPPRSPHPHLTYLHADFAKDNQQAAWMARLRGIDAVINAVGIFRESGEQTFARLHTETPCALFAACAASGSVQRVIQISALGADQQADTAYHLSKKAADDFLATLPLQSFVVQPSLVYGKNGVSARLFKVLASMPFTVRFGTSPQEVQPIHLDDAVAAIAALLRQPLPDGEAGGSTRRIALVGPTPLPFPAYLAALRKAMGMGTLRTLRLPGFVGRLAASLGIGLLDRDTLRMLDRGNTADPGATAQLLGHAPRAPDSFINHPAAERAQAKLGWLLPPLRLSVALVWIATAIVSAFFYPHALSYELLERTGVPPALGPLMLYGACAFDLAMGLGILLLRRRRWLWRAQLALIGFYTVVIALKLPEFLVHPYGPLTKNLPMLAAIWLLAEFEEA
jgi:nucleoside-diphosphate-sugar epimerase